MLKKKHPQLHPARTEHIPKAKGQIVALCHLLWMCHQIKEMDTQSPKDATKAGRWIGWIVAQAEFRDWWGNDYSRRIIKRDTKAGFNLPH